ncbi:hypothetical protein LEP1GSC021_1914 [Leptospira noguchii str. 1993005606]|nr:hypothetical protein LEP1GSC021_1914 [Leptospira noguchii str. 1993005606]
MNNFYRQFISHITVVYVVVLSHDITGGATCIWYNTKRIDRREFSKTLFQIKDDCYMLFPAYN